MEYLAIRSNRPGATPLVLIDGPPFTSWVAVEGIQWGDPVWKHSYSGQRGTQGARPSAGDPENRTVRIPLLYAGQSVDDAIGGVSELAAVLDECRRYGGLITAREHQATNRFHVEVLASDGVRVGSWGPEHNLHYRLSPTIEVVTPPYVLGDPLDTEITFLSSDDLADLTFEEGSAAGITFEAAGMKSASVTTRRMKVVGGGYEPGDCEVTLDFYCGAGWDTDWRVGIIIRRYDALNYVLVRVNEVGLDGTFLTVENVVGGSVLESATSTAYSGAREARLRVRTRGGRVWAALGPDSMSAAEAGTVSASGRYAVGGRKAAPEILWIAEAAAVSRIKAVDVAPFAWLTSGGGSQNAKLPLGSENTIPGDAPALCEARASFDGDAGEFPAWFMLAWAPEPTAYNRVPNGDLGPVAASGQPLEATGWSVAGDPDFAAGVSVERATNLNVSISIECAAASDSGATIRVPGPFRSGRSYVVEAGALNVTAGSTAKIMVAHDATTTSSVGVTNSTNGTDESVSFTMVDDADYVTVGLVAVDTAGPTIEALSVAVYELGAPPTITSQIQGRGGRPPFGVFTPIDAYERTDVTAGGVIDTAAAGDDADLAWKIDPALLAGDDYAQGELAVEALLDLTLPSTITDLVAKVSVEPLEGSGFGGTRWSQPFSSDGKALGLPASGTPTRRYLLGSVLMAVRDEAPGRALLRLAFSWASGATGTFTLNNLTLVLPRSRALGATARSLTGYRKFVTTDETAAVERIISSDLSGATRRIPYAGRAPDSGLGGSLLELPAGQLEVISITDARIPDNPDSDSATGTAAAAAHLRLVVTPRWHYMRTES